jgi:ankyrin repeat protein
MSTRSLPERPNLDHLRGQARALQWADGIALSSAQRKLAQEYGFASWPRLKSHVELVLEHSWDDSPSASDTDFCGLACLTYSDDDGPDRWERARHLLDANPGLTATDIWAASAAADPAAVAGLLAFDPGLARRRGGPHGWRPLFYLAYSRLPGMTVDAVREVTRSLLTAGADPNEGYLYGGRVPPFTALTGAFGNGEQGPVRQPRHPHSLVLARLLLAAGADSNDGQALYNRMFSAVDDHLELLLEYGLGRGEGGVWRERLGERLDSPTEMLRTLLWWAVQHHQVERVRLLADNGVDVRSPYSSDGRPAWRLAAGRTPVELATLNGDAAMVEALVAGGAAPPDLDPAGEVTAAVFAGDRAALDRLRVAHPDAIASLVESRPGLIVWAAAQGRADAVALLAELGFDVNARGRGDVPVESTWETALHHAASNGNVALARLLVSLGADLDARDERFDATPLDWARHFDRDETAEFLAHVASPPAR